MCFVGYSNSHQPSRCLRTWSSTSPAPDGFIVAFSSQSGAEGEAAIAAKVQNLKSEASKLDHLADELRELVAKFDPVQLIASIAVPAGMVLVDPTALDDTTRSFSNDAKIEYLPGMLLRRRPRSQRLGRCSLRSRLN